MALIYPGVGDIGTVVGGTAQTAPIIYNGGTETVGQIILPSAGVWLITVNGWWPFSLVPKGSIEVLGVCSTSSSEYQFSMSGVVSYSSAPQTLLLRLTNWSGDTANSVSVPGLRFKAVKVGLV